MTALRRIPAVAVVAALSLTSVAACSTHSADTYSRDEMGQAISLDRGTVLSVRQVKVEGSQSGVGAAAGAAAGGVGGYALGGNRTVNIVGAIGGAVIGGLIGLAAERGLTSDTAEEVLVQMDDGRAVAYVQKMDDPNALQPGDRVAVLRGEKTRVIKDTSGVPAPAVIPQSAAEGAAASGTDYTAPKPRQVWAPPPAQAPAPAPAPAQ